MIYSREYHYYDEIDEGSSHGGEYFRVSFQESATATVKDSDQRDAIHDRSQNCAKNHANLNKINNETTVSIKTDKIALRKKNA